MTVDTGLLLESLRGRENDNHLVGYNENGEQDVYFGMTGPRW